MDIHFWLLQNVVIYYVILIQIGTDGKTSNVSPTTYHLSRDCKEPPHRDKLYNINDIKRLQLELEGAVIYSHLSQDPYPAGLSCELIAHAPEGMQIMLRFEEFYIPSPKTICDDNYLYVFDSNTPQSRAMPEAGGEKGLCQRTYPNRPIFTTKSYITIVFRSTIGAPIYGNAGFKLVLTAVRDASKEGVCSPGGFFCGPNSPQSVVSLLRSGQAVAPARSSASALAVHGYCIPASLRCDGVVNCEDGRDERPKLAKCGDEEPDNFITLFFSLGVFRSIGIAVACIVFFIICIAVIVCLSYQCCHGSSAKGGPPTPGVRGGRPASGASYPSQGGLQGQQQLYPQQHPGGSMGRGLDRVVGANSPHLSLRNEYMMAKFSGGQHNGMSPYPFKKDGSPNDYQALVHVQHRQHLSSASSHSAPSHVYVYPTSINHHPPLTAGEGSLLSYQSSGSGLHYHHPAGPALHTGTSHRSHTPTSSKSGRSGRSGRSSHTTGRNSGVTYHVYGGPLLQHQHSYPAPPVVGRNTAVAQERIQFPVQL